MSYSDLLEAGPGTRIREPLPSRRLWHVRGVVDGRLVVRTRQSEKQRWYYAVEGKYWWVAKDGKIARKRKGKCG